MSLMCSTQGTWKWNLRSNKGIADHNSTKVRNIFLWKSGSLLMHGCIVLLWSLPDSQTSIEAFSCERFEPSLKYLQWSHKCYNTWRIREIKTALEAHVKFTRQNTPVSFTVNSHSDILRKPKSINNLEKIRVSWGLFTWFLLSSFDEAFVYGDTICFPLTPGIKAATHVSMSYAHCQNSFTWTTAWRFVSASVGRA